MKVTDLVAWSEALGVSMNEVSTVPAFSGAAGQCPA